MRPNVRIRGPVHTILVNIIIAATMKSQVKMVIVCLVSACVLFTCLVFLGKRGLEVRSEYIE